MPGSEPRPAAEAVDLVRASVAGADRVLVTGGSGWFGRTMLALLAHAHGPGWVGTHVLATAGSSRLIDVLGVGPVEVVRAQPEQVAAFAPTLIVNCAFPTRDRVAELGRQRYVALGRGLTRQFLGYLGLPSVERAVTLSSGAAVPSERFPDDVRRNPYGVLKAEEERATLRLARKTGRIAVVCRVWAVSGPHVQRPENYALSGMALEGLRSGTVTVRARGTVLRSYVSVEDALAVSSALCTRRSSLLDTGGVVAEVGEVAHAVAECLAGARVQRPERDPDTPADIYLGDTAAWDGLGTSLGLGERTLVEQVRDTLAGLAARV